MNNIRVSVIILPHFSELDDGHSFTSVYKNVEELSKNNGAEVLNLFPSVKGQDPSSLWIGITDSHPNEKAHRIYADEIYEFIMKQRLVPMFK